MRIMGIDYGYSRVGIAISDLFGWTAQGHETLKNEKEKTINKIVELAKENDVEKIVLGHPKNMDGSLGFRSEITIEFLKQLQEAFKGEVVLWDERLSTVAATKTLNETNVRGKKRKKVLDTLAAVYILQGYLDSLQR